MMRGVVTGQESLKKGFGAAQDVYGLAGRQAGLGAKKAVYGLDKAAAGTFETGVAGVIGQMDEAFAEPGEDFSTTAFEDIEWSRAGGKVPDRGETFLDMLTQLPDAGGT